MPAKKTSKQSSTSDIESGAPKEQAPPKRNRGNLITISDLSSYKGDTLEEQAESFVKAHPISMINRSWCLFSIDAIDFLLQLGVDVHSLELDKHHQGNAIMKHLSEKFKHKT